MNKDGTVYGPRLLPVFDSRIFAQGTSMPGSDVGSGAFQSVSDFVQTQSADRNALPQPASRGSDFPYKTNPDSAASCNGYLPRVAKPLLLSSLGIGRGR